MATKVNLELPDDLHGELKSKAAKTKIPLYVYIINILRKSTNDRKKSKNIISK